MKWGQAAGDLYLLGKHAFAAKMVQDSGRGLGVAQEMFQGAF
jgi:hypothetical protein